MDQSIVVTLNQWAAAQPLIKQLIFLIAERGIFLLPVALGILWVWPGANTSLRRQAILAGIIAAVIGLLLDEAIGHLLNRPRPFMALPIASLFAHGADPSFPSGHTIFGMALAGPFVWLRSRTGIWLALWALTIGASRVVAGVHYPSDVIGSTIMAAAISWATVLLLSFLLARLRLLRRITGLESGPDVSQHHIRAVDASSQQTLPV